MKLKTLFAATAVSLAVISCTEKPFGDVEVPEVETILSGRYASIDRYGYSNTMVEFFLGDYMVINLPEKYLVKDGKMWLCSLSEYSTSAEGKCRIDENGRLFFDDEEVSYLQLGDTLVLEGHYLIPIDDVVPQMHSSQKVEGVRLPEEPVEIFDGETTTIIPTIIPETALNKDVRWSSDNTEIASVDSYGKVVGLKEGITTIRVETKEGGFKASCTVKVDELYLRLDGEDGSKAANSYIVSGGAGRYAFDPGCKGNDRTNGLGGEIEDMIIVWESFSSDVTPEVNEIVSGISYDKKTGLARFTTSGKNGNALVAAVDRDGKILWSWHLWICKNFDPEVTKLEFRNNAGFGMDRNLGAISTTGADCSGLFYQWGRKDPFMGVVMRPADSRGYYRLQNTMARMENGYSWMVISDHYMTILEGIRNPTTVGDKAWAWSVEVDGYAWGDGSGKKKLDDPCPYGWKVPEKGFYAKVMESRDADKFYDEMSNTSLICVSLEGKMTNNGGYVPKAGERQGRSSNSGGIYLLTAYNKSTTGDTLYGGNFECEFYDRDYYIKFMTDTFFYGYHQKPLRCVKE